MISKNDNKKILGIRCGDNLEDESASNEGNQYAIQMELADQIFDAKREGCEKILQ